jgi:Transglycosylase SLT domain
VKPVFQGFYTPSAPLSQPRADPSAPEKRFAAISDRIEQAFDAASDSTGTPFDYLVQTARRESAFNPDAKAKTSTAAGLFQFTEATWLETLKKSGATYGLGNIADLIEKDSRGRYTVADPDLRSKILELRYDPEIASMMAGALTRSNAEHLQNKIGRAPTGGELYIAHFLGTGGATSLIRLASSNPDAAAADYFPRQAAANRSIFYSQGNARSVSEVYAELVRPHGDFDQPANFQPVMTAYTAVDTPADPAAAAVTETGAPMQSGWRAGAPGNAFAGLFRDGASTGAAVTAATWTGYSAAPALFDVAMAEDAQAEVGTIALSPAGASLATHRAFGPRGSGPLDLSQFLKPGDG